MVNLSYDAYEQDVSGSRIGRKIAQAGAVIALTGAGGMIAGLAAREANDLDVNPERQAEVSYSSDTFEDIVPLAGGTVIAGLVMAAGGGIANSIATRHQRRQLQ